MFLALFFSRLAGECPMEWKLKYLKMVFETVGGGLFSKRMEDVSPNFLYRLNKKLGVLWGKLFT